jgi:glutathione reductase (NADPH)
VFADPPLASVGLREPDAAVRGLDVEVRFHDTSGWVSSRRVGVRASGAKILVDRASDLIVGAHLLGHSAEEVVNLFSLAMRCGTTATQLREAMWSYPTASYEIVDLL